jgi:riboflavin biosynthesis pyrimidine reductase
MKPHVIMHMMSSIDGRIVTTAWPEKYNVGDLYERVHADLRGDAWIVGRATMAEFAAGEPRPISTEERFARETWKAPKADKGPYAIAFDRHGKLHLNKGDVNGDPLIIVMTTNVSDDHLAEVRDRAAAVGGRRRHQRRVPRSAVDRRGQPSADAGG